MLPIRRAWVSPWSDILTLRREMNDLIDGLGASTRSEPGQVVWAPSVNVREDEERLTIEAELPGVREEDVNVSLEDDVLTIAGEKREEQRRDKDNFHVLERRYGRFERSFAVGRNIDPSKIEATFRDGVLKVVLPKPEESRPRRIRIGVGEQGRQVGSGSDSGDGR